MLNRSGENNNDEEDALTTLAVKYKSVKSDQSDSD